VKAGKYLAEFRQYAYVVGLLDYLADYKKLYADLMKGRTTIQHFGWRAGFVLRIMLDLSL
jgi:hypothetical protein